MKPSSFRRVSLKSGVSKETPRFRLNLPVYKSNNKDGPKLLVVFDRVATFDIKGRSLLTNGVDETDLFWRIMRLACKDAGIIPSVINTINFHEFRIGKLEHNMARAAEIDFVERVREDIKHLQPDIVLLLGSDTAENILPTDVYNGNHVKGFGRVIEYKDVRYLWTLSMYELRREVQTKQGGLINAAGIVIDHISQLLQQESRYTVDPSKWKFKYVNTLEKLEKALNYLASKPSIAIDTETASLARVTNRLLSIQMGSATKQYFIPIDHPLEPIWKDDRHQQMIRNFLKKAKHKYHIMHSSKFDLTQIKEGFEIEFYHTPVYDTMGGEYALEENRKFLQKGMGMNPYRLEQLGWRYGCYEYDKLDVGKKERARLIDTAPRKFMPYGCIDVALPYAVHTFQKREAKRLGSDKFMLYNLEVLSPTNHVFSTMEGNGHLIDRTHLVNIMRPGGEFDNVLRRTRNKYKKSKAARKVNKMLLAESGEPEGSLFGDKGDRWAFSINKSHHKQLLFFNALGLEPLGEEGQNGYSVDKAFQNKYKDVKEVKWLNALQKYGHLNNNYVKTTWRRLNNEADALHDGRIRASYDFITVLTNRSSSSNPNFQNIPSRGELAKLIKRLFICRNGFIFVKVDYSAHEVRNWANVARDAALGQRFMLAWELRRKYRLAVAKEAIEELREELKKKGDIHIQNVKFFFGKWVDKEDPLRYQIKAIVFGVIYGKGANSLARELGIERNEAQDLIDKLFEGFPEGGKYIKQTQAETAKKFHLVTPFGFTRHLWGYLDNDSGINAAMDRRGPNSEIQGVSSNMGYIAGRECQIMVNDLFGEGKFKLQQNNMVHDSGEYETKLAELPISTYLIEHAMTTRVHKKCRETFGWTLAADLECEFEIGGSLASLSGWDMRYDTLMPIAENSVKWMKDELGYEINEKREFKKLAHNIEVIGDLRRTELKRLKNKEGPAEEMLLTKKMCKELML
jgi:DNA polymerase I-like protein with 3'-5' exonuclease and polymerase domains